MNAQDTIARLRGIRSTVAYGATARSVASQLEALEHDLAGTQPEDFGECPVAGFDTILSYLSRTNPEAFDLIDEPVHGTITDGLRAAHLARSRGIPVLRVVAPPHIQRRFPKAKTVNAYPTWFLDEFYGSHLAA